jgi:hypothetical protein
VVRSAANASALENPRTAPEIENAAIARLELSSSGAATQMIPTVDSSHSTANPRDLTLNRR